MSTSEARLRARLTARRWRIGGRVQGVGYRPFVYRLASSLGVDGWVRNRGGVVEVQAQGSAGRLEQFEAQLLSQAPPASRPQLLQARAIAPQDCAGFRILGSRADSGAAVHVPPDLFACEACLEELHDARARRYRYPFINCTQCGPRYTLIRAMPYDRANTTMAAFALCPQCQAEYADPLDRRFHAEPLACPRCGPRLRWEQAGGDVAGNEPALAACLEALRTGGIVALRGIGGYHLLCDARSEPAVAALRARKARPAKPLALMLPRRGPHGLAAVREVAQITTVQAEALLDPARPIVLLTRRGRSPLARSIAPGLNEIGVMLPYSPLHELILEAFDAPLVATSGNLSGEPVLTEVEEARQRLAGIADGFVHHDRPIARPADDPVLRVVAGRTRPLRLGRGTAPLELALAQPLPHPLLAVGSYMKNTIALAWTDRAVVSAHIGDLASPRGREIFGRVVADLQALYGVRAEALACDAHPDFPNSRWARRQGLPVRAVWHHHAHASALAGELAPSGPLLCFTWDGVGLGEDGTLWGGEALLGAPGQWRRVASFQPFRLPGGERAALAPWRSALGLCWSGGRDCPDLEAQVDPLLRRAFDQGLNAPATSAVGRLFDAASALLGLCHEASYDGEAPMRLEALAQRELGQHPQVGRLGSVELPLQQDAAGVWRSDCAPLVPMLLDARESPAQRAWRFHASLAAALCRQALAVRREVRLAQGDERFGLRVGLCGGVFQNRLLTEAACAALEAEGFEVLLAQRLPCNDAAISFGQIIEAAACGARSHP